MRDLRVEVQALFVEAEDFEERLLDAEHFARSRFLRKVQRARARPRPLPPLPCPMTCPRCGLGCHTIKHVEQCRGGLNPFSDCRRLRGK